MKRLIAVLLALALVLALAACGSTSTSTSASSSTASSAASSSASGTAASSAASDSSTASAGTETAAETEDLHQISDFVDFMLLSKRPETLNMQYSDGNAADLLCNTADPLLTCDNYGSVVECAAYEWGTEDGGQTWTLKLREGMTWVDSDGNYMADVVAEDYLWGLEWVLNFWKNEANGANTPCTYVAGAQEYYDYTKALDTAEAEQLDLTKFKEMVGMEAPDDYTIVFTCTTLVPYFDSMLTSGCFYPLPKDYCEANDAAEIRAPKYNTRWYCGPYRITTFVDSNEMVLTKNDSWWGLEDNYVFDTYTIKFVESDDIAYQMYLNGELDKISVTDATYTTIDSDPTNPQYGKVVLTTPYFTSKQMHFNYSKNLEDGTPDTNWNTAIGNEAFRLSMYYGLDLIDWLAQTNSMDPYAIQNTTFMVSNICTMSDGTDYVDLVKNALGFDYSNSSTEFVRLDSDLAEQYKAQAIEELTAAGVTFPVELDYYVMAGNSTAVDQATVLQSVFNKYLGSDYINFTIKTYVSSSRQEVYNPSYHSIYFSGWSGDYADPAAYLLEMSIHNDAAYYLTMDNMAGENASPEVTALFEEYAEMCDEANAIVDDMDARYEAFAEAEVFLLNHALMIPNSQNIDLELTCANCFSKVHAAFGVQNFRFINWETKIGGYTYDDYLANYQRWLNHEM